MNALPIQPDSCQMEPFSPEASSSKENATLATPFSPLGGMTGNGTYVEAEEAETLETMDTLETADRERPERAGEFVESVEISENPVSIPLTSYREDGFAHFFANEHRTFHPVGSDKASGVSGVSLTVGAGHRKLPQQQPSAAFHRALARKEGDPVLTVAEAFSDIGVVPARRRRPSGVSFANSPVNASVPVSLPLPEELLQGDPEHADHILARAFDDPSCNTSRKTKRRSTKSSSKGDTVKRSHRKDSALRPTLPMVRLVDGDMEFSESAASLERAEPSIDPNLRCLIESWPTLPRQVRDAVMAIVRIG